MRLIDVDAIPENEMNYHVWVFLRKQPTIEAEPVKHGRWLHVCRKGRLAEYECTECKIHVCFDKKIDGSIPPYKHCPNCGAKMYLEERKEQ